MARGPDFAVAKHLASKGLGTFFQDEIDAGRDPAELSGTLVAAGETPPRPDDAIVVLATIGGSFDSVGVQQDMFLEVQSRSASYGTAFERALDVSRTLHLAQGDLGGILMRVRANGPPASLGRDDGDLGGRWQFSQVFTAVLKQGEDTTP